jgi:hypothetical protein
MDFVRSDNIAALHHFYNLVGAMNNFLKNIFTGSDNQTFSMSKLVAIGGAVTMIYNFWHVGSVDFQGFGIGICTIITAMAAKTWSEK